MGKSKRNVKKNKRLRVYARDQYICRLCGLHCPPNEATIDHVVPVSKGGKDNVENLITAHKRCNERKGSDSTVPVRPARGTRKPSMDDAEMRASGME